MDNLSKKIVSKFQAQGVEPGEFKFKGKLYDLRTISMKEAEELHQQGCPYLKPVTSVTNKKSG